MAKKRIYFHREDADWLTKEICDLYALMAKELNIPDPGDTGLRRVLRVNLQERCDITEVEAINILNGHHIDDYVRKYEFIKGEIEAGRDWIEVKGEDKEYKQISIEIADEKIDDFNILEDD